MTEEFNKWWDNDLLTENNPYVDSTPAFWAWEGWCAAVMVEREACAKVCDDYDVKYDVCSSDTAESIATAIRARGNT
jgi:hypothetical protein